MNQTANGSEEPALNVDGWNNGKMEKCSPGNSMFNTDAGSG